MIILNTLATLVIGAPIAALLIYVMAVMAGEGSK